VNSSGSIDTGEPSALTDDAGRYVLDLRRRRVDQRLRVIATGGIDTDTGYAFTGKLAARADSATTGQLISPLTSLVDALVAQGMTAVRRGPGSPRCSG
jgi:hypothetical protein